MCLGGEQLEVPIGHSLMHKMAPRRHANLTLMRERRPCPGRGRRVEVGVVEHDQRTLAAQLQSDLLQTSPGQLTDPLAHDCRSSEADHCNVRIDDERLSRRGAAGQHGKDARRQAGALESASEQDATADRRAKVRLENHCVADRR